MAIVDQTACHLSSQCTHHTPLAIGHWISVRRCFQTGGRDRLVSSRSISLLSRLNGRKLKKSAEKVARRIQECSKGSQDVGNSTRRHVCMCGLNCCRKVMQWYSFLHWISCTVIGWSCHRIYLPKDIQTLKTSSPTMPEGLDSAQAYHTCPVTGSGMVKIAL